MKLTRRLAIVNVLLAGLVWLLLPAWANHESYPGSEVTGPTGEIISLSDLGKAAIGLKIAEVSKRPVSLQIATTGKIEAIPSRKFNEQSILPGRVTQVLVNLGQIVKSGQTLLMMDSPEINQLAAQALQNTSELKADIQETISQSDADIEQLNAQLELQQTIYNRTSRLFQEGIGAQKDVEAAQAEIKVTVSKIEAAQRKKEIDLGALQSKLKISSQSLRDQLKQLGATQGEVKGMLKKQQTILQVPLAAVRSGVITDINITAGQSVEPTTPLLQITDLSRVWATADIYEDDMARMRLGQNVTVKVAALPQEIFKGQVTFIGKVVDPDTRTLPVRIEINNQDMKLKPDMFAHLMIDTTEPRLSITVPREAITERTGHHLVFLEKKSGFEACGVELGRQVGDDVEVIRGLLPGDRIVVRGAFQLNAELLKTHGMKDLFVNPIEADHSHDHSESAPTSGVSLPAVALLVGFAFIFGFILSLFLRKRQQVNRDTLTQNVPADSERLTKG